MSGHVVVETAQIKCLAGASPTPLLVVAPRPITINQKRICITSDHVPMANIMPFGACALMQGMPCVPATGLPWTSTVHVVADGMKLPVLTRSSTLSCQVGGLIQIIDPGQITVSIT